MGETGEATVQLEFCSHEACYLQDAQGRRAHHQPV